MAEQIIHTVPSNTTVSEDLEGLMFEAKYFMNNNRQTFIIAGAILLSVFLNRSVMRRELRRITFSAEFLPGDDFFNYDWEGIGD